MIIKTMQMEYGMQDSRSAANVLGADGSVSVFQNSGAFIYQVNHFCKG